MKGANIIMAIFTLLICAALGFPLLIMIGELFTYGKNSLIHQIIYNDNEDNKRELNNSGIRG